MEAAEALSRRGLSTFREAVGDLVRSRSQVFWIVAGLMGLAAAIRFPTLGLQSYHHDEIVTATRILPAGFWHAMDAVGYSESAPPLYYALAWLWTQVTGTGEYGLRSISALLGVATVPVAFGIGDALRGRRTGIAAAALVAVNPMLVWYSQEARSYSLFALLAALSFLYFLRALPGVPDLGGQKRHLRTGTSSGGRREVVLWGVFSALALATHYFAIFLIAVEAIWLLRQRGGRDALPGLAIVVGVGALLAPLAFHQMSIGHAEWIGNHTLGNRLWGTGMTFLLGETGDIISRPERPLLLLVPGLLAAMALGLLLLRGDRDERRAVAMPVLLVAIAIAVPVAIGLLDQSKDYVLARNLMPALIPLLAALAVCFTLRRTRRLGTVLGALLVAYSLAFSVWASVSPALQRPGWSAVADALGEPRQPRAMVTWVLGEASLRYYLSTGAFQVIPSEGFHWLVGEVDFISDGSAPAPSPRLLGPGFRELSYERVGRFYIRRYEYRGPGLGALRLRTVRSAELGFRTNGVLLDGIGPQ
jgi:mannosyltransferase